MGDPPMERCRDEWHVGHEISTARGQKRCGEHCPTCDGQCDSRLLCIAPPPAAPGRERAAVRSDYSLSRDWCIARLCALQRKITEAVVGYDQPNDCFCGDTSRDGKPYDARHFRNSGQCIRYIENAVDAAILRDTPPKPATVTLGGVVWTRTEHAKAVEYDFDGMYVRANQGHPMHRSLWAALEAAWASQQEEKK